ncbi:MAG TPA: serine hydroxymethyltransferase [Candidatus Saccharimonadales bacterium]|nr:serine hydroxymethyltransferase [Candidatus Saccharimonadales bacterium]
MAVFDDAIAALIAAEEERQRDGLELIPSENYVSRQVLDAMGSVLTNKYSEGFPKRRYYGGQENTDKIEQLAIDRAKALFGADHANVQPHSGAQANEAAYHSWLEPGDTILGMELSHGGHLTHGRPGTVLAKLFNFVRYGMKDVETGEIDYEQLRALALKHKPKIILAGFSSFPRELDYAKFAEIGKEVNAVLMMDMAHIAGLIAGKQLKNPLDYGFHIVTTTTHKTLRGPRGGMILTRGTVGNPLKAPEKTVENLPVLVDRTVFPGVQGGPLEHVIAAKAVSFYEAAQPEFQQYAKQVLLNAQALATALMGKGFKLVTNGTDNHMVVADVQRSFGIHGGEAEGVLDRIGLNLNKNVIPDDPLPPFRPSGIRLGTPAITTRGLKESDMELIAAWMLDAITHRADDKKLDQLRREVTAFAKQFPLPSDQK